MKTIKQIMIKYGELCTKHENMKQKRNYPDTPVGIRKSEDDLKEMKSIEVQKELIEWVVEDES